MSYNQWENNNMPEKVDVESKKNPLLLVLIPVIILALVLIGIGGVMLLRGSQDGGYAKSLEQAELAIENGDIDAAITYYLEAIEADPSNAEPYLEAATLYEEAGQIEQAIELLERGSENTSSARIKNALEYLLRDQENQDVVLAELEEKVEEETVQVTLNGDFLFFISGAASGDFDSKFGDNAMTLNGGITVVTYTNAPVACYYNKTPAESTWPEYVSVRDLSYLFPGMSETISLEEIQNLPGVMEASKNDSATGSVIEFTADGCSVVIDCDETGVITKREAGNQITVVNRESQQGDEEEAQGVICTMSGTVIDATTGHGVSATMKFHEGTTSNGDVALEIEADSSGAYEAQLEPGDYVVEIQKEGYITEYFGLTVYSWIPKDNADYVISPELGEGQIRIVLEWGGTPSDLDSHLIGTSSSGQNVHMYFGDSRYANVCELDVDDTDGYGPETTTIYDIYGSYDFVVDDYTNSGMLGMSGATVKIYMPDESAPIIVTVPSDITDEWLVCSIRGGVLTVENRAY